MFPVENPTTKDLILRELRAQLRDDVNSYELRADGTETPHWSGSHDCQRLEPRQGTRTSAPLTGLGDCADERGVGP